MSKPTQAMIESAGSIAESPGPDAPDADALNDIGDICGRCHDSDEKRHFCRRWNRKLAWSRCFGAVRFTVHERCDACKKMKPYREEEST